MKMHMQSVPFVLITIVLILSAVPIPAGFARQSEPVTLYVDSTSDDAQSLAMFDPQGSFVVDYVQTENLFLGLTNSDPVTGSIVPELAVSWTISDDGRVWTFTLRNDVPWVRWDPAAGEATILRTVTAQDVAYGIQRACDPRTETAYIEMIERLIAGCNTLAARPVNEVTEEDYALVDVRALDDTTLEVHLQYAAGHFFSLTWNPILKAVPREVIEQYGHDWTQPGVLVTNGPFVLGEWRGGWSYTLVRNPYLPADLRGPGNVERVVVAVTDSDEETLFQAYLHNQYDLDGVPPEHRQEVKADPVLAAQISYRYMLATFYYAFANDKAPFDNVHVRRAFSAALDRARGCRDFYGDPSDCTPMIHFTPPGVFGAPPLDEVGVGFDPDYAREQLALAGYPGCAGFPEYLALAWEGGSQGFTYLADRLEEVLGCDPGLMRVEEAPFGQMLNRVDPASPDEYRPHMWVGGWGGDYPDAHAFLGDFLHCEGDNGFKRPCSEVDDLIDQAAAETDLLVRTELYRDIEDRFFGPQGVFPLIPLHIWVGWQLTKPWVEGPRTSHQGVMSYDWYTIDQAAQLAARGK